MYSKYYLHNKMATLIPVSLVEEDLPKLALVPPNVIVGSDERRTVFTTRPRHTKFTAKYLASMGV